MHTLAHSLTYKLQSCVYVLQNTERARFMEALMVDSLYYLELAMLRLALINM